MKYIILSGLIWLTAMLGTLPQAPVQVKGTVKDDLGHPLAYVSVDEKGVSNTVITDTAGNFSITVSKPNASLFFSFPGYESKEVKLKSATFISVQLISTAVHLDEVVVMGYSTQKKVALTGAAVTYHSVEMPALQGRVPGVNVKADRRSRTERESQQWYDDDKNTEGYDAIMENAFSSAKETPLSTFSIDVDAASYSNVRRYLNSGQLPPAGSVRVEEMINYFKYDYQQAEPTEHPFSVTTELGAAPWNSDHKLAMIHLQAKAIETKKLPASNLVFLIDVSGSMQDENKLPLVKQSMKLLTDQLREQDRVAMVVYAGSAGVVLPGTSGTNKQTIKDAIERLEAGGSTAGGAGIQLAYKIAKEQFVKDGNNRVILCTDGDFNVGASSDADMEKLIEQERKSGIYLTVLGYGMGNYKDNKMQKLADKGNGNHAYIDNMNEAKKVLVHEFGGTLFTVAKDVKLQVEFNPAQVQGYRMIGYENRMLNKEDFNDDAKDAGELGSGHTVTALYEIIPVGVKSDFIKTVDPLKYQSKNKQKKASYSGELMTVKLRYKRPDSDVSRLAEQAIVENHFNTTNVSNNFRFATAVAEFGMLLSNSTFKQASSYTNVLQRAHAALGEDQEGYRKEFIQLVQKAGSLAKTNNRPVDEEELAIHP